MASVRKREWTHKGVSKTAWVVEYTDLEGKRRRITCRSKKEADAERLRVETELANSTHVAVSKSVTVQVLCNEFLCHTEDRKRTGEIGGARERELRQAIINGILPYIGKLHLSEVTPLIIEDWYRDQCRDGFHPFTARRRVQTFGYVEAYAVRRGYAKIRHTEAASKHIRAKRYAPIRTATVQEIANLLRVAEAGRSRRGCDRGDATVNLVVNIAAFCGLRWGEIAALSVEDADHEGRVLRVRRSFSPTDGIKGPKTKAGIRDVPMPVHVAGLIREWRAVHHVSNSEGLLITTSTGCPLKVSNFHLHLWRPLLARAGLANAEKRLHFHALRHFSASAMIASGISLPDVASMLGHESFDLTLQVYAHPTLAAPHRRDAIDRMAAVLRSSPLTIDATASRHGDLSH